MITSKTVEALSLYQSLNEQYYEQNLNEEDHLPGEELIKKSFLRRIKDYFTSKDLLITLVYLVLLGAITALVSTFYSLIETSLVHLHNLLGNDGGRTIIENADQGAERILHYFLFVLHTVFWACLAACFPVYITKLGAGSGIPELKAILSGISMNRYLSLRTVVAKFFGLVLGAGAGLFTGREGPFVCLGACIANMLCKAPLFRQKFLKNATQHRSMLAAGAAVGIVSTFGTPIGGVIFSLEVTAAFYMVSDIWKCFFTCVVASILFQFVRFSGRVSSVEFTEFEMIKWSWDLFLVIILGVLVGMSGALFNTLVRKFGYYIKHFKHKHPIITVGLVALLTGIISYPTGLFIRNEWDETMNSMFAEHDIKEIGWLQMFGYEKIGYAGSVVPTLLVMWAVRMVITPLTIVCPLPTGIFVPSLAMGSILGRLYGEIIIALNISHNIPAGIYAIVGAAGMCTGVTHSIAVGVIILELTGQVYHALHVLLGTLFALSTSSSFCPSYYENALVSYNIPYLPYLVDPKSKETAREMMNPDIQFISMSVPLKELKAIVRKNPEYIAFPIVDSKDNMILMGSIQRRDLELILEQVGVLPSKNMTMSRSHSWVNFATRMKMLRARVKNEKSADGFNESSTTSLTGKHSSTASGLDGKGMSRPNGSQLTPGMHEPVLGPESLSTVPSVEILYRDDDDEFDTDNFDPRSLNPEVHTLSKWPNLPFDRAPLQVPEQTSRARIHLLFTMLACSFIYVTNQGRLVGVLTKRGIIKSAMR